MKYQKAIFYSLLFLIIGDAISDIGNVIGFDDNYLTPFLFASRYIALFIFIYIAAKSNWNNNIPQSISILLKVFLFWNIVTILRGLYLAKSYFDLKFVLGSSMLFFLIPLVFFVGENILLARIAFRFILKYLFTFGFLLIPLAFVTNHELYSRLMIPVSFFIILIPYLKPKWRKLILLVAVVSIAIVIDFRTNIIKTSISIALLGIYYLRRYILLSWIKVVHVVIFVLPLVFLYLAVSGTYNIFAESGKKSYTIKTVKNNTGDEENLAADTRSFLYVDVFTTLIKDGDIIMGKGASGKYKTEYFQTKETIGGRYGSEVGFLNILLYSGIIGLLLYVVILFTASYFAIYRSNSFLCKLLGILLAFRWLLFFIEEFTNFDLNTFFTWLIIGLISSQQFRAMTDKDLKQYLRF